MVLDDIMFDFKRSNAFILADLDQLTKDNYNSVSSDLSRDYKDTLQYIQHLLKFDYTDTVFKMQMEMFDILQADIKELERQLAPYRKVKPDGQIYWPDVDARGSLLLNIRAQKKKWLNLFFEIYPELKEGNTRVIEQDNAQQQQAPQPTQTTDTAQTTQTNYLPKDPLEEDSVQMPPDPDPKREEFEVLEQMQTPTAATEKPKSNTWLYVLGGLALGIGGYFLAKKKKK